eukprot:gene8391-8496_t
MSASRYFTKAAASVQGLRIADCADRAAGYLGSTRAHGSTMGLESTSFSLDPAANLLLRNF